MLSRNIACFSQSRSGDTYECVTVLTHNAYVELVPLSQWQDPEKRHRETVRAAHERDEAALLDLLAVYLSTKSRKRSQISPKTLTAYSLALRDYLAWVWPKDSPGPNFSILKATSDDLDRYVADLQSHGGHLSDRAPLVPATIASYLAGVRAFYRALAWAGAASPLTVSAPPDPTPPEERRPALPAALYQQLLARLSSNTPQDLRDRVAVRLLGETGLRISELCSLNTDDVDLKERILLVKRGKGGKSRSVPLAPGLSSDLGLWQRERLAYALPGEKAFLVNLGGRKASGRRLSPSMLRKILAGYYQELGFPERYHGAHMLRHTAGTRIYRGTRDLHVTARILGHQNLNTSAIYAKMDLEGLRQTIDQLEDEDS